MKGLDEIYFAARELPPAERPAYLATACQSDGALRARVEQMLAVADAAEAFITDGPETDREDHQAARVLAKTLKLEFADTPDEIVGQKIGRYKILERLGEGGCGVVYVAEQTEPVRRRVALKVIKLGMDTKSVVARFEAERQALAMMDHSNIAKVLDAGATETGRPYFVMELVRGIRITDYCDQNNLPTQGRLDLFIQVCHAIQHAHQKGIIHRDIKPSNILVTLHDGVPVPKVIDFGIAKATEGRLTDATVYTQLHQFIGTPAYMSPEQAEMSGLDIDTRSDIYSLGVLLYELLAGTTPFDAKELMASGIDAMRRTIRENEPIRPSTKLSALSGAEMTTIAKRHGVEPSKLSHQLQGDLDWIVMKCLEKDRTRRYESASGLANDLKRHLTHEPVVARPPSTAYKLLKTWQRNKLAFAATAAVVCALLAGTGVSIWQAVEATRARKQEIKERITAQNAEALATTNQKKAEAEQKKAESEKQRAEAQLTRAEWLLYASKLTIAQNDFESGNGGLTRHYLEQCQPEIRGWEWRHLWSRVSPKQILSGHSTEVTSVAYSPDGTRLVTGSEDTTAKIWDVATGRELLTLKGHTGYVVAVAFSPDGARVVTAGGKWAADKVPGEVKIWDVKTGQLIHDLTGHTYAAWSVAFSPDGQRLVSGAASRSFDRGETKLWDAATGQEISTIQDAGRSVYSVAFSPDGERIITGSIEGKAKVWDATTARELFRLNNGRDTVWAVAFSPDGRRMLASSGLQAKVWDAATGRELFSLQRHDNTITSVAFSPDHRRIVTGSHDQTAKVWDARNGRELFALKGNFGNVRGVAFSPDNRSIVTVGHDKLVKIWDGVIGQEIPVLGDQIGAMMSIAITSDSQRAVLANADGSAKIWDVANNREVLTLKASNETDQDKVTVWGAAFSPDNRRVVTASQDRTARLWDAGTGEQLFTLPHRQPVRGVAFSPDGQKIVTSTGDWGKPSEIKIWNAATGESLRVFQHPTPVWSVAFSPDSRRIVAGCDNQLAKVWDITTGENTLTLKGHGKRVWQVTFSPDGQRIATACEDTITRLWDAQTGQLLVALQGHTDSVRSVAFSPDGRRVATGSEDWTAKIWDAEAGYELLTFKRHPQMVYAVAFTPDGQRVLTGTAGVYGTARVWYAPTATQMTVK